MTSGIGAIDRVLARVGKRRWRKAVHDVMTRLHAALMTDYVVLGGGNARKLKEQPDWARLGANTNAFVGGYRLWEGCPPASKSKGKS